jgi:hypothetical protein
MKLPATERWAREQLSVHHRILERFRESNVRAKETDWPVMGRPPVSVNRALTMGCHDPPGRPEEIQ